MTAPSVIVDPSPVADVPEVLTVEYLEQLWASHEVIRENQKNRRLARPWIRLWDGDWNYVCTIGDAITGSFQWKLNATGVGMLEVPLDSYSSNWAQDITERETRNVHVTVDKDGARWSGRCKNIAMNQKTDGTYSTVFAFNSDYEELKFLQAWCNPFLPSAIQFPRIFILAGPSITMIKLALFCNLLRVNESLWQLPDNPLDFNQWPNLDWHDWAVTIKPITLGSVWHDTSMWTILSSRFKNFDDMIATTLEDAQLMMKFDRYLEGDPPPWPGANLRHGALVIDVVDKSGYYAETALMGTLAGGFIRTAASIADNLIDETLVDVFDPVDDPQYTVSNWLGTTPKQPWAVYRCGPRTGIESSSFIIQPASAPTINVGGHSMYGVNEGISAAIQTSGNILSAVLTQGYFSTAGTIADTFLRPLYEDTILAWMSLKSIVRAQHCGWSHYYEYFQQGADRAYSLSSIMVIRAGLWATRSFFSHQMEVRDGAPFMIGDNGRGHLFLGDRVGSIPRGAPGHNNRVYVDQVTELVLTIDRKAGTTWKITVGEVRSQEQPMVKAFRLIKQTSEALHTLGVL